MKEKWVPVRSKGELRAGMVVKVVDARTLIGNHPLGTVVAVLLRKVRRVRSCWCGEEHVYTWETTIKKPRFLRLAHSIKEGRAFRMDTGLTDEQAAREMRKLMAPRETTQQCGNFKVTR